MILLNTLLPLLALAAASDLRLPQAGHFAYGGQFEVMQKRVVEGVRLDTAEGKARLEELRKQGQACNFSGNYMARCTGFVSVEGAEREVQEKVNSLLQGSVLEFAPRVGEPALQIQGDTYEEWSVPQSGSFRGKAFEGYRYQIVHEGPHKMIFGEDGVVVEENGFSYVTAIQKTLKREMIATYLIRATLQ